MGRSSSRRSVVRSDAFMAAALRDWGPAVWRCALTQTSSWADAEDVYQETFIRLATDGTAFADGQHLKAWLLRVAINLSRDCARARRRRDATSLDEGALDVPDELDLEGRVIRNDEIARLMRAVRALPAKQRAAVHLHYGEGLACDEVAAVLGTKPSTVRMRLKRARDRLKRQMGGGVHGGAGSLAAGAEGVRRAASSQ